MTESDVRDLIVDAVDTGELAEHFYALVGAVRRLEASVRKNEESRRGLDWLFEDGDETEVQKPSPQKPKAKGKVNVEIPLKLRDARQLEKYQMGIAAAEKLTQTSATGTKIRQNSGPARQTTVAARTPTAGTRGVAGVHRPLSEAESKAITKADAKRSAPNFQLRNQQAVDAYRRKAGQPSVAVERQIMLDAAEAASTPGQWDAWLHSCKKATAHYLAMPETLKFLRS